MNVDTAGVQAMATRWGALTGGLHEAAAPTGLGLSCQTSAAAVEAAHGEVAAFTAGLAALVDGRAAHVVKADTSYVAHEATSAAALAAIFNRW
jgi:hypothetical protein